MTKKIAVVMMICLSFFVKAQNIDLANLTQGTLIYSTTLYDSDNNLYGYVYLFNQDKIDDQTQKMELVFLDKNLNKVSNNTFTKKIFKKVFDKILSVSLVGDFLMINKYYYNYKYEPIANTYQMISLKNKNVLAETTYENGIFKEFSGDYRKLKNEKIDNYNFVAGYNNKNIKGFFVFENNIKSYKNKELRFFDEDKNLKWSYVYNDKGSEKEYIAMQWINDKNNNLYLSESKWHRGKYIEEYKIVCLDIQTGNKKFEYVIENLKSKYSHTVRLREHDGKVYITGNYSPYDKKDDFQLDDNLGYYRIQLDQTGKEVLKRYTTWDEFSKKIEIDEKGRVEKNFRLRPTQFFVFKDGTTAILTEKFKPAKTGFSGLGLIPIVGAIANSAISSSEKTTDFLVFNFDKDFNSTDIITIDKQLSKNYNYDYLFSQYIKEETGAVFFYQDYVDEKNEKGRDEKKWILGINTIIDGKIKEEKIPISSEKKYQISPQRAKEGYILLREYNEKDKYNQIRLEKLNY